MNDRSLKFAVIQFFNSCFEISRSFELDKTSKCQLYFCKKRSVTTPFAVIATCFRIYHIELTSASSKVFQILLLVRYLILKHSSIFWSYLPTRIGMESCDLHAINSSPRTGYLTLLRSKVILSSRSACELYSQSFSFEFGSVCVENVRNSGCQGM